MTVKFTLWEDPGQRGWHWIGPWPYQLTPQLGKPPDTGPPPGRRIPIISKDPQRPIRGLDWQYGYTISSQAPSPEQALTSSGVPIPPGSPWGATGAAAPDLDAFGVYPQWPAQKGATIAGVITPPYVPPPPIPTSYALFYSLRAQWDTTWQPPPHVQIATLQPPAAPTNPPPLSLVNFYQLRLSWPDPVWPAQRQGYVNNIPFVPPPPPSFPPFMPELVGLELWEGIAALEAAGVLVPSALGYFGTYPITVIWVSKPRPGTKFVCPDDSVTYFPSAPGPGLIIYQSIPAGAHAAENTPITLMVVEYPFSVIFP